MYTYNKLTVMKLLNCDAATAIKVLAMLPSNTSTMRQKEFAQACRNANARLNKQHRIDTPFSGSQKIGAVSRLAQMGCVPTETGAALMFVPQQGIHTATQATVEWTPEFGYRAQLYVIESGNRTLQYSCQHYPALQDALATIMSLMGFTKADETAANELAYQLAIIESTP